jgi:type II secretory ATPase GspE/PulE/Tfp pilus assembly ATPase PilB-like protein
MAYGGYNTSMQDVVSSFNRDEKENEVQAKADELSMPYVDVRKIELSPDVLAFVSKEEARLGIIPLLKKKKELTIGLADPNKEEAKKIAEYLSRFYSITLALISWESVKDALPLFEGLTKHEMEKPKEYEIEALEAPATFKELGIQINSAPLQNILSFVVSSALQSRASDIHFEPQKNGARIRFRIDGVLHVVGTLPQDRFEYILSQIQLASGMKLNVDQAQQGRLEIKLDGKNTSVRVETMPTLYGDDISLRIFNTDAAMLQLEDLGLYEYSAKAIQNVLNRPQGMILVVGPTGAGKTSTIYAILNKLNHPQVKIITLEDPIEYALEGISQSQIQEGESFLTRLKAVLREDPDIVMVGEIRDGETGDVALHGSLTGHMMISTFHANNAVTALGLLREIVPNSTLLASAVSLVVGQRLVRKICPHCKELYKPTPEELEFATRMLAELPKEVKKDRTPNFYEGKGCDVCNGLGYQGRIGIFEMLSLTLDMQKMVSRTDVTVAELQEAAKKTGMITMEQDGVLKVVDGLTSIKEVMKAIKED